MTLLTALMVVLSRNSGATDVVVGTPVAGRNRPELEGLIGFFVNMLVLRSNLLGAPILRQLINQVRANCLAAYSHQDCPFELLVEELQPQRDLSRHPIFQISFSLQRDLETNSSSSSGLRFQPMGGSVPRTHFDLECLVQERQEALFVTILYNPDLFMAKTAKRIGKNFQRIVEDITGNPDQKLSEISLLDESDLQKQLVDWNTTSTAYPKEKSLSTLFDEQVGTQPDAVAVVSGETLITYNRLNQRATQMAHWLRRQGVGQESRVGVCLERGVDLIVSLLAILKAGGAYVPLDLTTPSERLTHLIEDAEIEIIVTQETHHTIGEGREHLPVWTIEWILPTLMQEPETSSALPTTGAALAYVMYTSGSTGQPKGTLISQHSMVRLVKATDYIQIAQQDRVGHLATPTFDALTFEVWEALLNGGMLVVFDQEQVSIPLLCASRLQEHRISALFLTTALFNQLVRENPTAFAAVNTVLFGGELVDQKWVEAVWQAGPPRRLVHVYGPTESTTFATWHPVTPMNVKRSTVPIGRPLSNTQGYIMDRWQNLVPVGVPGEVVIGGDGLAWGYLNQPALIAERFVPHPHWTEPGSRVYRSGDLGRWNGEGAIEFQGRRDGQVKVRGHRIELGEIEATLSRHPAAQEVVVICREDLPGNKEVVAYIVGERGRVGTRSCARILSSVSRATWFRVYSCGERSCP